MRDGNLEAYVMDADGTDQARVTNHPALDALPTWSPDSKLLAFVSERTAKGRGACSSSAPTEPAPACLRGAFDMSPDWARG